MRIYLAGASGVISVRLVPLLMPAEIPSGRRPLLAGNKAPAQCEAGVPRGSLDYDGGNAPIAPRSPLVRRVLIVNGRGDDRQ